MRRDSIQIHRLVEMAGIVILFVYLAAMVLAVREPWGNFGAGRLWILPCSVLAAYLVADFISGFVHFMADTFGSEETPILGPNFIRPFREHHRDPTGMTKHDFIETNGNNCLICLPFIVAIYHGVDPATGFLSCLVTTFFALLAMAIVATNQIHKWAHLEKPPGWVAFLQSRRWILSVEHHARHHASPYERNFCITTGWLNPILERVRFFERSKAFFIRLGVPTGEGHEAE